MLRPGGVALFYAWAQEQHAGRSGHRFERQDVFVAWHQRDGATGAAGDVLQRYCHVYCEGELRALVANWDVPPADEDEARDAPDGPDAAPFEEKHCVGKFFDTGGYFWEAGFAETVQKMVAKFESKKKQ